MKTMFKRMTAFAMAAMMMFAMAVAASATTYTATFYKDGSTTETSMANDAVAGAPTITTTTVNNVTTCHVSIPVKPINYVYNGVTYTGYISGVTVAGATNVVSPTPTYTTGYITFDMQTSLTTLLSTGYDVTFQVQLYDAKGGHVGTPHDLIEYAPKDIAADLAITAVSE